MKLKDVFSKEIIPLTGKKNFFSLLVSLFYRRIDLQCVLFYRLAIISKNNFFYFFPLFFYNKLVKRFNCYISLSSKIGMGIRFPHPSSIIIGKGVIIGSNCIIYQDVTIGAGKKGEGAKSKYPIIGDNVIIYAGAKILGDVILGDNVVIGANSVVTKSFPNNSILVGIPAKRIDDYVQK